MIIKILKENQIDEKRSYDWDQTFLPTIKTRWKNKIKIENSTLFSAIANAISFGQSAIFLFGWGFYLRLDYRSGH